MARSTQPWTGGGRDSDDWYIENEVLVAENASIEDEDSDARDEAENDGRSSKSDDGFVDSVALLNRQKKQLQRQRQRDHPKLPSPIFLETTTPN